MDKTEIKEDLEKAGNEAEKDPVENKTENEKAAAEPEEGEVAKLKGELEAAKEKYIRLYSEFENFRKRTAKEKHELIQSANEQLLKNLLPVVDDFERAENSFPDKTDKDLAGFFLIHSKFKKILDLYGVRTMEAQQGTDFNADLHEAITQLEAPSELKGKIIDVVEKGYILNDKVIRYAKVVVGK
ncbi:MAG TPA: nucleotide exchange factor GrpE [Chryseosolibacter sp.]|nr:nucleotide exchange factor GrpE [Chryseosolibacter sp.]